MPLVTKDYNELVSEQAAAIQAQAGNVQFPKGSVTLATIQSNAGIGIWLEGIILQLLAITRASSCNGTDLDTWMADYGFTRNPAIAASGLVTFSRATTTQQALILVGTTVQTEGATQIYNVYADPANPNYNIALNGYVINSGTASISVPVVDTVAGASGNVSAGEINQITSVIPYVDSVTNGADFTSGQDQESDPAFRARFILYINSRSLGTILAVENAIQAGNTGILYNVIQNQNFNGDVQLGFFTVVIDSNGGGASQELIDKVTAQVDAVRGLTIQFGVYAAIDLPVNIVINVDKNDLYSDTEIEADINAALSNFFSPTDGTQNFSIGDDLIYNKLFQIVYNSSPGIETITALTANSGTSNITATFKQRLVLGTVDITIN